MRRTQKMPKKMPVAVQAAIVHLPQLNLYAQAFDQVGKLDRLEGFASHFGADFYGLPRNTNTITLVKEDQVIPESFDYLDGEKIIPLYAGKTIQWRKV